jgi:GH24 family phage-related lysozyme (muramidase)
VNHLYLDTQGYVTVGIGTMLPNLAAAQALPFVVRASNRPASAKDIEADFHAMTSQAAAQVAKKYKPHTQLDLPEAHIDALLDAEITAREASLRAHFPGYDNYPAGPKRALIDMVFNLGIGSLSNRTGLLAFKNMKAAIVASDWRQAAAACHRKGPSDARNAWTHDRFLEAAP